MVNVSWELALPLKNILDYGYLIFEKYTENSNIYFVFIVCWALFLEKAMATHSSILAWRIPGTEEPSGLPSMGSHRVRYD